MWKATWKAAIPNPSCRLVVAGGDKGCYPFRGVVPVDSEGQQNRRLFNAAPQWLAAFFSDS